MFSEEEVDSIDPTEIKLNNLIEYKIHDEQLRKNFQVSLQNFRRIENRFLKIDAYIDSQLKKIERRFEATESVLRQQSEAHRTWQEQFNEKYLEVEDQFDTVSQILKERKQEIEELVAERRAQSQVNSATKERLESHDSNDEYFHKEVAKILESLQKKSEKTQIEKSKRDLGNLQLKFEMFAKKQKDLEDKVRGIHSLMESEAESVGNAREVLGTERLSSWLRELTQKFDGLTGDSGTRRESTKILELTETTQIQERRRLEESLIKDQFSEVNTRLQELGARLERISEFQLKMKELTINTDSVKEMIKTSQLTNNALAEVEELLSVSKAKIAQLEEKMVCSERRLDSFRYTIDTLDSKLKTMDIGRLEERTREMQVDIFNRFKDIHFRNDKKVEQAEFNSFVERMDKVTGLMQASLAEKAEKQLTKKALHFLEVKLKELVQIVSTQEDNFKNSLLTKKLLKCLSCDKELDCLQTVVGQESHPRPLVISQEKQQRLQEHLLMRRTARTRMQPRNITSVERSDQLTQFCVSRGTNR